MTIISSSNSSTPENHSSSTEDSFGPACAVPQRNRSSYGGRVDLSFLNHVPARVYSKPTCPHCSQAIDILCELQVNLEIFDVTDDPELRQKISESVGNFPTVPMIFLGDQFVGGCDDLRNKLQNPGQLRTWLGL